MRFAYFLILIITLMSCSKNEQFKSEIVHDKNFIKQSKSCKNVDLYNNPLNHANSLELFKCFNWDIQYPKLFSYLMNSKSDDWDFVVEPLNKAFFNDEAIREEFLNVVGKLKNNNGFDNLHSFVKVLFSNEKLLNLLIELTERDNKFRKKYINSLGSKTISIKEMIPGLLAYRDSLESVSKYKKEFNLSFTKLNEKEFFPKLIPVVDSIADYLIGNEKSKHVSILSNFSLDENNSSMMLNLVSNGFDRDDFSDVFLYSSDHYKEIKEDFKIFNESLMVELVCEGSNDQYNFNISSKYEVFKKVDALLTFDENKFWQELVDSKAKLATFSNFCNPLVDEVELLQVLTRIHQQSEKFFTKPMNFSLMAELHKLLYDSSDENTKLNFIKLLDSNFSKALINLSDFVASKDRDFYGHIFDVIKGFGFNFYGNLDEFIETAIKEENNQNLSLVGEVWNSLTDDQKYELLVLLKYHTDERFNFYQIIKYYTDFLMLNENLGDIFYSTIFRDETDSTRSLDILNREIKKLKSENLLDELASFLSRDSLIRLFEFFSTGYKDNNIGSEDDISNEINIVNYSFINNEVRDCLFNVTQTMTSDFYESVFEMPSLCSDHFSGKMVFDAMTSLKNANEEFKEQSGVNLIGKDLLLNPQMMRDIFSGIVGLHYYGKQNELINVDLSEIVDPLNEYFFKKKNYIFLDDFVSLINEINDKDSKKFQFKLINALESFIVDKNLNNILFESIANASTINQNYKKQKCTDIISDFDDHKCADKEILKKYIKNIYEMIFEKNDSNVQFLEEAVNLFRKDIGIKIPVRNKKNKSENLTLTLKRFGEMLTTLTESRKKEVLYKTSNNEYKTQTNVLSRIEAVIKDIGFLDNFYGAFFMNKVAESKDYVKDIKKLKKNVKLLKNTGGLFRSTKVFPESTKYQLDNIWETYDSLWEAGEEGFSDELQASLALVSITSPDKNSDFQPYRIPKVEKVKGHKGQILTRLSEIRALSHFAELYKVNYWKNNRFISDEKLDVISENFLMIFSEEKLKKTLRDLDLNRDKVFVVIDSIVDMLYDLPNESIGQLKSIIWDFLYLTHKTFKNNEADFILSDLSTVIDIVYKFIVNSKISKEVIIEIIDDLSKFLSSLSEMNLDDSNIESIKKLLKQLFSEIDIVNYINEIIEDDSLFIKVDKLISGYINVSDNFKNSDKVFLTLRDYLNSNQFNGNSLVNFLRVNSEINESEYLTSLIRYLAKKDNITEQSNLSKTFKFLFNEDKERMKIFLQEINNSVTFETR